MINWSRLSIERKMEISNEMRAFIKNNLYEGRFSFDWC